MATSTKATYETIRDAATGGESAKPAKSTTTVYRDLLEAMWLVDPLPAWWPLGNPLSRLMRGPKHHLADPALAARLIGATASGLVSGSPAAPRGPARGRCSGRSSSRWSPWTCGSTHRPPEPPWGICEHGTTTARST